MRSHFIKLSLLFGLTFPLSLVRAASPAEIEGMKLLEAYGGKLTPEAVVRSAMKSSPTYSAITSQSYVVESFRLQSEIATDTRLYAKAGYIDDQLQPLTVFSPNRTIATRFAVGVGKLFSTGTALSAEVSHGTNDLRFPTLGQLTPNESRATLSLEQSLWQNAFGSALRRGEAALLSSAKANQETLNESKEGWFLDALSIYYSAWLAQRQHLAAVQSLKRRDRLLKIIDIKVNRGTSERPDALQVRSAHHSARIQMRQTEQTLGDRWRELVVGLRLPEMLLQIDPMVIPLEIDSPVAEAEKLCGAAGKISEAPKTFTTIEKARAQYDAAKSGFERAESEVLPDLKLGVALAANSVDSTSSGNTVGDLVKVTHPSLGVNLTLTVPLANSEKESKLQLAKAELIRAEATQSIALDRIKVQWKNTCEDLFRLGESVQLLTEAVKMQSEREKLEEQRFSIGRSNTIQVIQAGDDATDSELRLRAGEVQLRTVAWQVKRLSGDVLKKLAELEK